MELEPCSRKKAPEPRQFHFYDGSAVLVAQQIVLHTQSGLVPNFEDPVAQI